MFSDIIDSLMPETAVDVNMSLDIQDIMNEQRKQKIISLQSIFPALCSTGIIILGHQCWQWIRADTFATS